MAAIERVMFSTAYGVEKKSSVVTGMQKWNEKKN